MQQDDEIIREFLIESNENLNRLDAEIVDLEQRPTPEGLASIFRTIHTIKGTCGFLGFQTLEEITHHAENILSQLRSGDRRVTGPIVSLILETVDVVRQILTKIESDGNEGDNSFSELLQRLERASEEDEQAIATSQKKAASPGPESQGIATAQVSAPVDGADEAAEAMKTVAQERPAPKCVGANSSSAPAEEKASIAESAIRVDVSLLDKLMNLVGELVLARNQILQFTQQRGHQELAPASQRLNLITSELQESVMKMRMQAIGVVFNKLPRVVRDIALALGKEISLEVEGADTELDKTIVEAIKDPITHMIRNACDHGIESLDVRCSKGKPAQGMLRLKAYHEGGKVNIELCDDGAGVDVERVKAKAIERGLISQEQAGRLSAREALGLLFVPGFSTARTVTNLSGRGVGMDVVKSNIEKIGGSVDISTVLGEGTTVRLKIPLTLAIIPGLIVSTGGHRFVIPQVSLLELIRLEGDALKRIDFVHETQVYRRRGLLLPIASLGDILRLPDQGCEVRNLIVLQAEERQFGLIVDAVEDTQEIVVKPLGQPLKGLGCYSGATIMGDGSVALILDVPGIGYKSALLSAGRPRIHDEASWVPTSSQLSSQRVLLFKSGRFERLALPLSLVARLEEVRSDGVELASGRQVVQYRDQILPLVALGSILGGGAGEHVAPLPRDGDNLLQVVVISNQEQTLGLVVDEILDIVEEAITIRRPSSPTKGILGSAVIGKKVTDIVDLEQVIELSGEKLSQRREPAKATIVLVADASAFTRGLLKMHIELAGYQVAEASGVPEIKQRVESLDVGALVASPDLLLHRTAASISEITSARGIPILAVADNPQQISLLKAAGLDCVEYQVRTERGAMLDALSRLTRSIGHPPREAAKQRKGQSLMEEGGVSPCLAHF